MSPQPVPSVAQRCHWYANEVGLSLHVPFDAVSVWPSRSVPEMLGAALFCGAALERATATAATTPAATSTPRTAASLRAAQRRCLVRLLISTPPCRRLPRRDSQEEPFVPRPEQVLTKRLRLASPRG